MIKAHSNTLKFSWRQWIVLENTSLYLMSNLLDSSPESSPEDLPPPDAATAAWRWPAHPGREVQNGTPTVRQRPSKSLRLTSTTSPEGEALARQSSEVSAKLEKF